MHVRLQGVGNFPTLLYPVQMHVRLQGVGNFPTLQWPSSNARLIVRCKILNYVGNFATFTQTTYIVTNIFLSPFHPPSFKTEKNSEMEC